jgi:transposase
MQLKTILNQVARQPGFVFGQVRLTENDGKSELEVELIPRKNSRPICSGCGSRRPGYDRLNPRRFQFIPLWNIAFYFLYALRRVNCPECGIVSERVPWAKGKEQTTRDFQLFLSSWARHLSWQVTANMFGTSWDTVYRAIRYVVSWGIANSEDGQMGAIGIDEIQYRRGHNYMTLVYQLGGKVRRLLFVGRDRTEASLEPYLSLKDKETKAGIKFVCTDMWKPYLNVVKEHLGHAINVLDRFHISKKFGEALDKIRASEARQLEADGYEPVLKHSRWCLLKRKENLTDTQTVKLRELMKYNLASVKAYLMRADFDRFWTYTSPAWARKFLRDWCSRAQRSQIEPMMALARMLLRHEELLLNWFSADGLSSGIVEGFNNKAKLAMRKAYGFKSFDTLETALYHQLGKLPEPKSTHRFCG